MLTLHVRVADTLTSRAGQTQANDTAEARTALTGFYSDTSHKLVTRKNTATRGEVGKPPGRKKKNFILVERLTMGAKDVGNTFVTVHQE